jgi:cytochrome c oxidase cbb3-type subunit III
MRYPLTVAIIAVSTCAAVGAAMQQGTPPPGGQGRPRGPNFPQQQRPPGDPTAIARGRALYGVNCTLCHGADLRGGDQGGPNLLRSEVVLVDQKGEAILPIVRDGRKGPVGVMPAFSNLAENDILAIAEFIHSVMAQAGRQGRPPERETPIELNVLVGDAAAGKLFFERACSRCHSTTGDLQGIASRVTDARALQDLWISGGASARGPRFGGDGGSNDDSTRVTVTVTTPKGPPVTGRLVRIDDFTVTLLQDDGVRRTFRREGGAPKVEITDPLEPHRRLVLELTDGLMHNVTAYLATLK